MNVTDTPIQPEYDELAYQATQQALDFGAIQKPHEFMGLLEWVKYLNPRVIVEIGSDMGGTLHGFHIIAPTAALISIDLSNGPFGTGRPLGAPIGTFCIRNNSQAQETVDYLKSKLHGQPIDVLFIDADHSYEGVKKDYELYSPLVRSGGIVAFHDICVHPDASVGVWRFWRELTGDKAELVVEPANWGGIGVIKVP